LDNLDEALEGIDRLTSANTKKVSVLGARAVVLSKFLGAALPHLRTSQRAGIARSFRQGIEEAMSLTDDVRLPAEYHSALLDSQIPSSPHLVTNRPGIDRISWG
jgi:hypothetical protein